MLPRHVFLVHVFHETFSLVKLLPESISHLLYSCFMSGCWLLRFFIFNGRFSVSFLSWAGLFLFFFSIGGTISVSFLSWAKLFLFLSYHGWSYFCFFLIISGAISFSFLSWAELVLFLSYHGRS